MRIVMLEPLNVPDELIKQHGDNLKEHGHGFVSFAERDEDQEELVRRSHDADVVILSNIPLPGAVIARCPALKMISVAFTGVDHIDMEKCRQRGITVCNAAGYADQAVAELVIGQVISLLRKLALCDRATRSGGTRQGLPGREISGKTAGIIGAGAIGTRVGQLLNKFGCKIIACDTARKNAPKDLGISFVDLSTLLRESDIITLHVPLTEKTRGLIGKENISLMKPDCLLINASRGPVVDSQALADALRENRLGGAAIDVFEGEPPIDSKHPLLGAPNAALTPHIGFATQEAFNRRLEIVFENISKWMEDKPQNVME